MRGAGEVVLGKAPPGVRRRKAQACPGFAVGPDGSKTS